MTRLEMRRVLRQRIADDRNTRWTDDSYLDLELNLAATYVAREIAQYQRMNFCNARTSFVTTGATANYDIEMPEAEGVPPFPQALWGKIWYMYESRSAQPVVPCQQIDEREWPHKASTSGRNDFGHWYFYIRRHNMLDTVAGALNLGQTEISFVVIPPANLTFYIHGSLLPASILIGDTTADALSFVAIPDQFHEMVPVRAGLQLIGTDEARYGFLAATWNDLYAKMRDEVTYMPDTMTLRRTPRGDAVPALLSPAARGPATPVPFSGGA